MSTGTLVGYSASALLGVYFGCRGVNAFRSWQEFVFSFLSGAVTTVLCERLWRFL